MPNEHRKAPKSSIELEELVNDTYAKELGYLLHDWNDLHIALAVCQYDDKEEAKDILLAIWNAIPNDRLQRHMIRQAAKARFDEAQLTEILWTLDSADSLGQKRDVSAHLPVGFLIYDNVRLAVNDITNHPIAKRMKDKDILAEFNLIRARVAITFGLYGIIRSTTARIHCLKDHYGHLLFRHRRIKPRRRNRANGGPSASLDHLRRDLDFVFGRASPSRFRG
jgi:hypothetical protein